MISITVGSDSYDVPSNAADQNWAAKQIAFEQALAVAVNSALASINTLSAPLTWNDLTLDNGWANKATFQGAQYAKAVDGTVYLRGAIADGAGSPFTMPSAYRPAAKQAFIVLSDGGPSQLTISDDGTTVLISLSGAPDVLTSISGVFYSTL